MRWFAIHHNLSTHPKWLELSMEERGAWISLLTIAAAAEDRGTLRDRETASALLQREMRQASRPASHLVASLIDLGLLDQDDENGLLSFHDFDEWQLRIKKPSDLPAAIRERVERSRRKKKEEQKEEREVDLDGDGEVTPRNALPNTNGADHGTCPSCGSAVVLKEGSRGTFYSCSTWNDGAGCHWKSNAPPSPPTSAWKPSAADLAEIEAAHRVVDTMAAKATGL